MLPKRDGTVGMTGSWLAYLLGLPCVKICAGQRTSFTIMLIALKKPDMMQTLIREDQVDIFTIINNDNNT